MKSQVLEAPVVSAEYDVLEVFANLERRYEDPEYGQMVEQRLEVLSIAHTGHPVGERIRAIVAESFPGWTLPVGGWWIPELEFEM